jgi:hypothetical protein
MTTHCADLRRPAAREGIAAVHAAIDGLQRAQTGGHEAGDYEAEVVELDRAVRRLESIKLSVLAAADAARVADLSGLADTSAWLARRTRTGAAQAAQDVRLAAALAPAEATADSPPSHRPCASALAEGALSTEHARVIVRATEQLPRGLSHDAVTAIERDLVEKAGRMAPDQLRRVARRALASVEDDQARVDEHEDALLRSEEAVALSRTRLSLHDNGDGTTSGHFTVPTVAAAILTKAIQSMTAPRRARLGATEAQAGDAMLSRDWAHQSGLAFVELLEHLPTDHLHSKVAATVVVTIDYDRLVSAVGAAGLDTNDSLSAGDLRRLACGAGILPAVLRGQSLPLDLGRSSRLFSGAQQVALATKHSTCAAEGCDRPFSWSELHHLDPWGAGGLTDLAKAVPLCGFHHRRIHDPAYEHHHGPDGITFLRRRVHVQQ